MSSSDQLIYSCRKVGCRDLFKHRIQRDRHERICEKTDPPPRSKGYSKVEEGFKCDRCMFNTVHRKSILRHVESKVCEKDVKLYTCDICNKEFCHESRFNTHKELHNKLDSQTCTTCNAVFRRKDHYESHQKKGCVFPCMLFEDPTPISSNVLKSVAEPLNDHTKVPDAEVVNLVEKEVGDMDVHCVETFIEANAEVVNSETVNEEITIVNMLLSPPPSQPPSPPPSKKNYNETSTNCNEILITESDTTSEQKKMYFKQYRSEERARRSLESVVSSLASKVTLDKLTFNTDTKEKKVFNDLILYLRDLYNSGKHSELFKMMLEMFNEKMNDTEFLKWLSSKMEIRYYNFQRSFDVLIRNNFIEKRGTAALNPEVLQAVYSEWVENSVNSTDGRNGRNYVNISKKNYDQKYGGITDTVVEVEEHKNKRGTTVMSANKMVSTCSIREIRQKLEAKGFDVSLGTVFNIRPFFITFATEKELSLCLCMLCLNTRLLFDPLMVKAKADGDETFESLSEFFMSLCRCFRSPCGYFKWKCVSQSCKECKNIKPADIQCQSSNQEVKVEQFETKNRAYNKFNENTNTMEEKNSRRTEREVLQMAYKDLYQKLVSQKKLYTMHKYHVYNDKYHWKIILQTTNELGDIFHGDFSENMTQLHKFEPQSSHFNKAAYSLHCTVIHGKPDEPPQYAYHISGDMTHDWAYTTHVIDHLYELRKPKVLRFKSDNCGAQYKCKWIFAYLRTLAMKLQKLVISYYGAKGHGKGLVDAMSGFGVKEPIRRAVYRKNLFYNSAADIYHYLIETFKGDDKKHHFLVDSEVLNERRKEKHGLTIDGCMKMHMIAYFPDGGIQAKVNICSCNMCLYGNFVSCQHEKGIHVMRDAETDDDGSSDNDSDNESDHDECNDILDEYEEYEMRSDSVLDIIGVDSIIALYSPPTSLELFYLCKVIEFGVAKDDLMDEYNHVISKGSKYIKCQYLEKLSEKKRHVTFKLLPDMVYVLPVQVKSPLVNLADDLSLSIAEYQWLTDSI